MGANEQIKNDRDYMDRCIQLARLGAGYVAPNPMVGSVLVYQNRIIGEGYHREYGKAHAEVNCIASVSRYDQQHIPFATLYVSLEPCAHFGKTPPCADLIIRHKIPRVVVGCRDPFDLVNGKGIEKLEAAGIEVTVNVMEKECLELNKRFFTFHREKRPYIILKWAQTADQKIAAAAGQPRLMISNDHSNRLVHRWRQEEAAIFVGRKTVELDDPALTNRLWSGNSPLRLVLDPALQLPASSKVLDGNIPTVVFNHVKEEVLPNLHYQQVAAGPSLLQKVIFLLHRRNITSVLVEGGAQLLQSFIDAGIWDEARIITNESKRIGEGLAAPQLHSYHRVYSERSTTDLVEIFTNKA
ncbi:MAG: bifunctional diaminohydroxyphosphoribosylaminopyrimidine deaminase/5-amino-6-(5-phosphoribosylamino)uracil reductase RibD [Chitinophagaceae bacterium]|nr:MAG: bifunctional diaminohydroxyphosphoribosylaminopyrimidine deaminase/5-amino-6-(5-phosphoribosylamino)uracil reductase RibD [Chitinophagaceae bacterium]